MARRRSGDSGGSELRLIGVLDAGTITVPVGYVRKASLRVAASATDKEDARLLLDVLGLLNGEVEER